MRKNFAHYESYENVRLRPLHSLSFVLVIVFFVFGPALHGQAVYDTNGVVSNGPGVNLVVPEGFNRLLVVHAGTFGTNRSATFNGMPMTEIITRTADDIWPGRSTIFILPLGTGCQFAGTVEVNSGNVRRDLPGGPARIFWTGTFRNVEQMAPIADQGAALDPPGSGASDIGGLTTAAGMDILFDGLVIGGNGANPPAPTPTGAGSLELYNSLYSSGGGRSAARIRRAAGGDETVHWTVATGWEKPHVAVVLNGIAGPLMPGTLMCKEDTLYLDESGLAILDTLDIFKSTDCPRDTLILSRDSFFCADIGPNTVTLTAIDANGNSATCTATVTVLDTLDPTGDCGPDILVNLFAGYCDTILALSPPNAGDNCSVSEIEWRYQEVDDMGNPIPGPDDNWSMWRAAADNMQLFAFGFYQIQWRVTDVTGDVTTCTQGLQVVRFPYEICANGIDDDCNGATDDVDAAGFCCNFGNSTQYNYIHAVYMIGSCNNVSGDDGGFGDFTGLPCILPASDRFHLYLQPGGNPYLGKYWQVWIDWNNSGGFEPWERVASHYGSGGFYKTVVIPAGFAGDVRMRIQSKLGGYGNTCGVFGYGETEDYTLSGGQPAQPAQWLATGSVEGSADVQVYPNPFHDQFLLSLDRFNGEEVSVSVVDITGKTVYRETLQTPPAGPADKTIDASAWPGGMYMLVVTREGIQTTRRIIKE